MRRLRDVDVVLDPTTRQTRSDSLGAFRFVGVAAGEYRVRVRRIGFEAVVMKILAISDHDVAVNVAMQPSAQALATMTIAGKRIDYPVRLTEAYTRMRRSTGYFVTREQIDSLFPRDVSSLLMRIPGVRVIGMGDFEFARCDTERNVHVWVDGTRWTKYFSRDTLINVNATKAVRDIPVSSIQLMEVYSGVARIPGEYLDDACAVILIWRK
ncbi:MAG: carboxypeptidase regulatory-like domain-containing protein [Gemmatimonadaceae bacterium]|nr:carboxypeptidase regulatory-like domain-containing protein [Gemmatimonadaceae bacterium]